MNYSFKDPLHAKYSALFETSCHLISEHEGDDFQDVEAPLLFTLSTGQELQQIIQSTHVNSPQQFIVNTGIIIHILHINARKSSNTKKHKIPEGKWCEGPKLCLTECCFNSISEFIFSSKTGASRTDKLGEMLRER